MPNQQYDDELRGVLFRSQKKADNHPDMHGFVTINGVEYKLAGWSRTSGKGTKYLSLKVTPPEDQQQAFQAQQQPQRQAVPVPDDDDPLPF